MIIVHHVNICKFLQNQSENLITITQLHEGHENVKLPLKNKHLINQDRVYNSVRENQDLKDNVEIPEYQLSISYHLKL